MIRLPSIIVTIGLSTAALNSCTSPDQSASSSLDQSASSSITQPAATPSEPPASITKTTGELRGGTAERADRPEPAIAPSQAQTPALKSDNQSEGGAARFSYRIINDNSSFPDEGGDVIRDILVSPFDPTEANMHRLGQQLWLETQDNELAIISIWDEDIGRDQRSRVVLHEVVRANEKRPSGRRDSMTSHLLGTYVKRQGVNEITVLIGNENTPPRVFEFEQAKRSAPKTDSSDRAGKAPASSLQPSHSPESTVQLDPSKRVAYKVVEKWDAGRTGQGMTIVVAPMARTEENFSVLGNQLSKETEACDFACIYVFDDEIAAASRRAAEDGKITRAAADRVFDHMLGLYQRFERTGVDEFTAYLDVSATKQKVIKFNGIKRKK